MFLTYAVYETMNDATCPQSYCSHYSHTHLLSEEKRHSCIHEPCAADQGLPASEAASSLPHVNCTSMGYLLAVTQMTANEMQVMAVCFNTAVKKLC